MSIDYRYEYEDEERRYLRTCHHCQCEAPLYLFKRVHTERNVGALEGEEQWMCEVCSVTFISNTCNYGTALYAESRQNAICLAQVANLLLDKLTGRKPPEGGDGD